MKLTLLSPLSCLFPVIVAHQLDAATNDFFVSGPFDVGMSLSTAARHDDYGPLVTRQEKETQRQYSFSPLFSTTVDPDLDMRETDFLYPLFTGDRFGTEYRFQFFQVFSFAGGSSQQDVETRRYSIFPIFLSQRSIDTNKNYTAVMPFYGQLKNRLMRDEIKFVLIPLYLQSRKKDVITDNYLLPFFHLRHGNSLKGWQLWPVTGWEEKGVTTKTNSVDEVEVVGGHKKFFAAWPLYFRQETGLGTENPQTNRVFLPFYSLLRSPLRDSSTYLWPWFSYTDDREKKYHEWGTPWPLIVFARGEGKHTSRVWPFFSEASNAYLESDFYFWPLYKFNRFHDTAVDRQRQRIAFFLYSDTVEKDPDTGVGKQRTDLWPLFTAKRDRDGKEELSMLSFLEPIFPNSKSIERNYSPVWSVAHSEKDPKTGANSQSVLWNLYRREAGPQTKSYSFLFGMIKYQSDPQGRQWRWFYLPAGKSKPQSPESQPRPAVTQHPSSPAAERREAENTQPSKGGD